jgi:hypothetical protein
MWFMQGELGRARAALARAHALAVSAGDADVVVRSDHLSARVEHALGNVDAARERFRAAVAGFELLAIPWGVGNAQTGMAAVAAASGNPDEAERLLDEAAPALEHAGPWFLTRALFVRGILALRRGNADETIALLRESLTSIRELNDTFALVYALAPLAAAAAIKGDHVAAARILGARDAISDRTGTTVPMKLVQDLREQAEQASRTGLGRERWDAAYAAGRKISLDSLLRDIDTAFGRPPGRRHKSQAAAISSRVPARPDSPR